MEKPRIERFGKTETTPPSFPLRVGPLLFLVAIFFLNILSRVILSPLMPTVEKDLKVGHDEAGIFFLLISLGYCIILLVSGFISSRLNHRRTIILSSTAVGGALLIVGLSHHLWATRFGVLLLGVAAGFYLPSGIATITGLVNPRDWGKAIAIHELAPNLGFLAAPFLAEVLLGWFSWRGVMMVLGTASIGAAIVFAFWGKGGAFPGEAPNSRVLRTILVEPSFWIMIGLFTLGIGGQLGVYSMMPLYLVSERGMERTWANTLLGLSRASALAMPLLSGWVTDRLGPRLTLKTVLLTTGLITIMLGVIPGPWIVLLIFLQPMFAACFFTPGFAALSRIGSPSIKNVTVSLTVPIGFLLGGGAIPAGIGLLGEAGSFPLGFALLGGFLLGSTLFVRYLKFNDSF
jgi:NNP family nitrate/nitrite transporter-like MFS transporter